MSEGMILCIKPENDTVMMMYVEHDTYHTGDSGLDLFFPEDINISPKETVTIDLQIQCEALKNVIDLDADPPLLGDVFFRMERGVGSP